VYIIIEAHLVLPFLFVAREGLELLLEQEKYELLFLLFHERNISTSHSNVGRETENLTCHGCCH
jgi:hypothetical protein